MAQNAVTAMPGLQKAVLRVYKENSTQDITCMFNPAQYSVRESTGYAKKKGVGQNDSKPQYTGGNTSSMSFTIYYDTTDNMGQLADDVKGQSVMSYVQAINALIQMEDDQHKPPEVEFIWGDFSYKGVLSSLNKEFSYFDTGGKPLRAKLDLTITGVPKVSSALANPKNSPDRTKYRTVQEGMSLWKLAWDEYRDCERWKDIARFNGLMNPLDIKPGQVLKLPALESF